jgi:hypothetical protein
MKFDITLVNWTLVYEIAVQLLRIELYLMRKLKIIFTGKSENFCDEKSVTFSMSHRGGGNSYEGISPLLKNFASSVIS